jgi:hypothetical protein
VKRSRRPLNRALNAEIGETDEKRSTTTGRCKGVSERVAQASLIGASERFHCARARRRRGSSRRPEYLQAGPHAWCKRQSRSVRPCLLLIVNLPRCTQGEVGEGGVSVFDRSERALSFCACTAEAGLMLLVTVSPGRAPCVVQAPEPLRRGGSDTIASQTQHRRRPVGRRAVR